MLDDPRLPIRFWNKVEPCPMSGCWLWVGATDKGYGQIHWKRKTAKAYRIAYEILIGPVPDGLEIDHLCRVSACVNPAHLEPVTHQENMRRSAMASHARGAKFCRPGRHLLTPETTYTGPTGESYCRECKREALRRQYRRTHAPRTS